MEVYNQLGPGFLEIVYKDALEVKAANIIHESHQSQAFNYLAVSRERIAIIVNFGEEKLNYQRLVK